MKNGVNGLQIPEFEKEFFHMPNDETCKIIDETRLMIEILGGLKKNTLEFSESDLKNKILLDGDFSILFRYKREKDEIYHPTSAFSFCEDEKGNITIKQLQSAKGSVAFRFNSSFDILSFYKEFIEENFSKKGIYVDLELPDGLPYLNKSNERYIKLKNLINMLNKKYNLKKI